ncbi:Histone deacetylase complex subunit [Sporothrix eucalyptigena]|uniref:Histone deacetylase complex subunit n=1 Tax=Sporothrix eucalyptigena TaxID=1812306 RepID=A0ABP0CFM4_9PEZI
MAGPDPRRSSRARTNQPQSRPSSTTSSVSGRLDRHSKQFVKTGSPQKSASTASLASEPPDDAAGTDDNTPPPPTRSRRAAHANVIKDDDPDQSSVVVSEIEMTNDGDDIQEDDEAVRCICGFEDYPGPPAAEDIEQAAKEGYDVEAIFPAVVTDDLAGFFVQCDICKVWQHGACVGLVNDATLPEEYYCEDCRKDLHKIFPGTNSHRCSIYLALNRRRSRTGSFNRNRERTPQIRDSSKDSKDEGREIGPDSKGSRASAVSQSGKRRSTMNSRDAAYDEEQLLIAIAASKEDNHETDSTLRRPKRSRSDSEEKADITKRQRTSSRSVSPPPGKGDLADDSDDAMATRNGSTKKASRSAALARSQAQRERAEKEEKERQRAEAASKRNGRAERRRVDDSDPSDEAPLATTRSAAARTTSAPGQTATTPATASTSGNASATPTNAPSSSATPAPTNAPRSAPARPSQPSPETPPPTSAPAMAQSKSKGGRPTHKKKGRNQYTKERDAREELNMTRSRSRDVPESGQSKSGSGSGGGSHGKDGGNSKSGSRAKGSANSRVSLAEMRRRVSAMSDFIGKTQIDIASGEYLASAVATPDGAKGGSGNGATNPSSAATTPSSTSAPQLGTINGISTELTGEKDFKTLPLLEMMDTLTRNIIHWQNQYGG